jgi:hypothetical protein
MFNISQIVLIPFMARYSGIYTNIITPREQQTKVGLQRHKIPLNPSAVLF